MDNQAEFERLAHKWDQECAYLSSIEEIYAHPAYQEIIKMGKDVIPFILYRLKDQPNHWFMALWTITHENPISPKHRGMIYEMTQDWLKCKKSSSQILT